MKRVFEIITTAIILTSINPAARADPKADAKAFQKLVYDQIGSQWYKRLKANENDAVLGTIHVTFALSDDGAVRDLRVVSNSSNRLMAQLAFDAIKHAKIPRPPADVLKHGEMLEDMTFTVYPN